MKFDRIPLRDLAEIIMGVSPSGSTYNNVGDGLPLLNGPTEFGITYPACTLYTTDSKRESQKDDIIFCVRGSTIGKMNWSDRVYSLGRGVCSIRGKNIFITRYVKYCIDLHLEDLLKIAGGGTFPNLSKNDIGGLRIPNILYKEKIASILYGFDDLIENNLKRIKLLEKEAQCYYEEMMYDSNLWEKRYLEEFVTVIKGKKPGNVIEFPDEDCQLYLLLDTIEKTKTLYTNDISLPLSKEYDVLMCMDGARSGVVFRGMNGAIGSTMAIWRSNSDIINGEMLFQYLKKNELSIMQGNTGAAIPHANKKFILDFKMPVPPQKVTERYLIVTEPIIKLINNLHTQNAKLREARDILLPQLMSRRIRV